MPWLTLTLLLSLTACTATQAGPWPSLAMRPGELAPLVPRPTASAAAATPAAAVPEAGDAAARLASIERDLKAFEARLGTQRETTARAAAAGRGQALDSAAGSAAQVELSRIDRLGGQASDLRDRLDALAGDLAVRAAAGVGVDAVLLRTGAVIAKLEVLRGEQARALAAATAAAPP